MPQYQGVWTLPVAARLQSTQQWATDPLYRNTTLLLQADNAPNGAQNNTFIDSSSNNFTITRNGNATQGTFTPYSATGWSNYFTGSGSYLSNTSTALIGSTVSTFTAEAWIYMTAVPTSDANNVGSVITLDGQAAGTINYLAFGPLTNQKLYLRWFDGAGKTCNGSTVLALNTWYHIAVVVSSNTISMYVNGVPETLSGTTTLTNRNGTSNQFAIATNNYTNFSGYISNVRVTNTAVYTSSFTPSTIPLTSPSGTLLLTCQSNRFVDTNTQTTSKTLTPASSLTSVEAFSPFAPQYQYTPSVTGGSGYFDGTGDYLSSATSTDLQLGSSDFSLEWWEYRTAANNVDTAIVCGDGLFSAALGYYNSGAVRFYLSTTGSSWNVFSDTSAGTTASNSWNHFVLTRSGTAFRVFLNGVLGAYATGSGSVTQTTNQIFISGGINGNSVPIEGYMSGVRFVKGSIPTTYQTSSTTTNTSIFTPPTAPVTTTSQGTTSGDVKYLVNFTNAGIYDGTLKNNLETVGNAQVSTSVVKYGTGSMAFDGTGDYLVTPSSPVNILGSGDFTIEFWAYPNNTSSAYRALVASENYAATTGGWSIYQNGTSIEIWLSTATQLINATSAITATTWQHVALSRASGTVRLFVNGTSVASASNTAEWTGQRIFIGDNNYAGTDYFYNGYLDDLRITKGVARYTANFTPPRVALPRQ